jgi:hypothetical protein
MLMVFDSFQGMQVSAFRGDELTITLAIIGGEPSTYVLIDRKELCMAGLITDLIE